MSLKYNTIQERPREKLARKGATALSDLELLQAIIGSGNKQAGVADIARQTHKLLQHHGIDLTPRQLSQVVGLGSAKVTEFLAAFELARRYLLEPDQPIVNSFDDAVKLLAGLRLKRQEHFVCLTLDGANRLIAKRIIGIGPLAAGKVNLRNVFADVIADHAAAIIVVHNHPSGSLVCSAADMALLRRLQFAADTLGITVTDLIVLTSSSQRSIHRRH